MKTEIKPKWMKVNCPKDMTYHRDYPTTCDTCKFNKDCGVKKVTHSCKNCRYLAGERFDLCYMHYCSIGNDEENAKQGNDEANTCPDFQL